MHVFIDDSGDGGFKFESGASSHLVMAAAVFRDPKQIESLKYALQACKILNNHKPEFKYAKTKERVKDCFFDCTEHIDYDLRVIFMDKSKLYSLKLRSSPSALKSFAIRMLLTKNCNQIRRAKIVIDGQDTKGFGIEDRDYLMRMVNRESPGTIRDVKFDDSKFSAGIQLADMAAGAVNRCIRTNKPSSDKHLLRIRERAHQPRGSYWNFTR